VKRGWSILFQVRRFVLLGCGLLGLTACDSASGGAPGVDAGEPVPYDGGPPPARCSGAVRTSLRPGAPPAAPALTVPSSFKLETVAAVSGARELAALPNGDLLVGTLGKSIYLVANADGSDAPADPVVFATFGESLAQGIGFAASTCTIYAATPSALYALPYVDGQVSASPGSPIARVRTGAIAPNSDGDVHRTTSVAFAGGALYAGVGSSCNACTEVDPTRATVQRLDPSGANMRTRATRFRNAIALTENPTTGTLWAGGAGQDNLPLGHPYEFLDAVTLHDGVADYGWPDCEENAHPYTAGADCSKTVTPLVEFPAYSTLIGVVFYPLAPSGANAFPAQYRGGVFVALHGSWHTKPDGTYYSPPRVAFVPMNGDAPKTPVNWSDPSAQWTEFVGGCQLADGKTRIARPTGIAVGPAGSLFVADDEAGRVYRIRPR
jgi:glucose/arabinose dehydrogenase